MSESCGAREARLPGGVTVAGPYETPGSVLPRCYWLYYSSASPGVVELSLLDAGGAHEMPRVELRLDHCDKSRVAALAARLAWWVASGKILDLPEPPA